MIGKISLGDSCLFKKFRVSFFTKKFFNGTPESSVETGCEVIEVASEIDAEAEELKPKANETEDVVGRALGVDVVFTVVCVKCKTRIDDGQSNSNCEFVECGSCKTTMLKENLKKASLQYRDYGRKW